MNQTLEYQLTQLNTITRCYGFTTARWSIEADGSATVQLPAPDTSDKATLTQDQQRLTALSNCLGASTNQESWRYNGNGSFSYNLPPIELTCLARRVQRAERFAAQKPGAGAALS